MTDPYPGIRFSPYPLIIPPVPAPPKAELEHFPTAFGPMNVDFPIEVPIPFDNPRHHTYLPPMPILTPNDFGVPLPGYKVGGRVYTSHLHSSRIFGHYQETTACVTKPERDTYMFIYSNKLDEDGFQMVTDACTAGFKASYYVPRLHPHNDHPLQTALVSTYCYVCEQPGTFTRQLHIRDANDVKHVRDDNLTWLELQAIGRFLHYCPERFMLEDANHYPWNSSYVEDVRQEIVDVVNFDNNYVQLPAGIDHYSLDYTSFPLYHKQTGRLICRDPNGFETAAVKLMDAHRDQYLPVLRGIAGFAELVSEDANMYFIDGERRLERMLMDVMNHHHGRFARCRHCGHAGEQDDQDGH
ncbi:hypothetical protein CPB85DRAFT_1288603 [Mucidula mucida]|nr:hypothetical protein CPB85DRAFT_1288603 [Mucidula mucida]